MSRLAIIIPCYKNHLAWLEEALSNLYPQLTSDSKVTVVVNGGFTELLNRLASIFKEIDFVIIPQKVTAGFARNIGAARNVDALWYAFTDADCVPANNYIAVVKEMISRCTENESVFAGCIYPLGKQKLSILEWGVSEPDSYLTYLGDPPKIASYLTGANFLIRASLFNSIEGYDPGHLYTETRELASRLSRNGAIIYFKPELQVAHRFHSNISQISIRHLKHGWGNGRIAAMMRNDMSTLLTNRKLSFQRIMGNFIKRRQLSFTIFAVWVWSLYSIAYFSSFSFWRGSSIKQISSY